jgi:dihydroorotate dehydrogenase (NAD+) catalytic subunit
VNLSVQLAPKNKRGLLLSNPVMTASGTFGYGTEYSSLIDIRKLGAIICKGTTLEAREGNPQPRVCETEGGMLNAIGLQNIGAEALIKDKAPEWAKWDVPVIVNIAGKTIDDYAKLAAMLDNVAGISGLEVNISCPNVKAGGVEFGTNPDSAAAVTSAVRKATTLPVIVKLTPNVGDIKTIALAVEAAGADALTLINTLRGMAIDIRKKKPLLGNITGGLSGPVIKPVALSMVYETAGVVKIPVIGCGGITTATEAIEFLMAGASAVQVGTAIFVDPQAPIDIIEGIKDYMSQNGFDDINRLIGIAR